jgi:hypothetical protein
MIELAIVLLLLASSGIFVIGLSYIIVLLSPWYNTKLEKIDRKLKDKY